MLSILSLSCTLWTQAQVVDTSSIYKDRKDSLKAAVFVGRHRDGLSKGKELRTELISASGLQKMACCNLAESFENSASVTVGYSDATTGARQIRLLGLSGAYTQIPTAEGLPSMGISSQNPTQHPSIPVMLVKS